MHPSGSILDGKYEIRQRLGGGGMSEVFLARHLHLEEDRVIKILRRDLTADPAASQRFLQDAGIARQIEHENVAVLHDYARLPDGSFYMAWEHIVGEDVGSRLRRAGPFPPRLAVDLALQALEGLEAIHSAGMIHRDVSPDSLLLTATAGGSCRLRIIDLGLAKVRGGAADLTPAGALLGKFRYRSPEQSRSGREEEVDHRSDLYSLAAVLYEMICGLPPFESETAHGYLFKRLTEDPMPMARRRPDGEVAPGLERVVLRGLARDPEARFPDAASFRRALAAIAGELAAERPLGPPEPEAPASVASAPSGVASAPSGVASAPSGVASAPSGGRPAPPPEPPELSREERRELLGRIERASKRREAASRLLASAEAALADGRVEEAAALAARLEAAHPGASGLVRLKAGLARREEAAERDERIRQAAAMLERYLQERRPPLARLALDTLLELDPAHPMRGDYETWVAMLDDEVAVQGQVEAAAAAAREALERGDLRAARRRLEAMARLAPGGPEAEALGRAIEAAAAASRTAADAERHRGRFERFLSRGEVAQAERELARLSALDVPRVTIALYRARLEEARAEAAAEPRYRERLAAADWQGAREVALALEKAAPESRRPATWFAEVAQQEEEARRRQAGS